MKLTETAINKIRDREMVLKLCFVLDFSELWVTKLIENNKDNGPLTTSVAVKAIREGTGLTNEQILEESPTLKTA